MKRNMHKRSKRKKQKEQLRTKRLLKMMTRPGESLSFPFSFDFILMHWGQCIFLKLGVGKSMMYFLFVLVFFYLLWLIRL